MAEEWGAKNPKRQWSESPGSMTPKTGPPKAPRGAWTGQGSNYAQTDIKGVDAVCRNLKYLADRMVRNVRPAMVEVVALIQRESMKRTPIRTGFLRASHRSQVRGVGYKTVGTIFVMAYYAIFVHEAPPSVQFRSPWPRGRKFLERAILESLSAIRSIIYKWVKIGVP